MMKYAVYGIKISVCDALLRFSNQEYLQAAKIIENNQFRTI